MDAIKPNKKIMLRHKKLVKIIEIQMTDLEDSQVRGTVGKVLGKVLVLLLAVSLCFTRCYTSSECVRVAQMRQRRALRNGTYWARS